MVNLEVEAKFLVTDLDLFTRYRQSMEIAGYKLGDYREVYVTDEYLDTEQHDIWDAGFRLRVRECSGKHSITVKSAHSQHAQFSVRDQIEFPVSSETDVEHWGNEEARALIESLVQGRKLRTSVQLRQIRGQRDIFLRNTQVAMLSLDQVEVRRNEEPLDEFHVLEVELLPRVGHNVLEDITRHLQIEGLIPQTVAKLQRALDAVAGLMTVEEYVA